MHFCRGCMADAAALILLVEDDDLILEMLEDALKLAGFGVVTAPDGRGAMAALDQGDEIRAVVTDIRLGPGPEGWEVAQHARAKSMDMGVVYMSGDSCHHWMIKGVPKSVLVPKPFVPAQIIAALANLLNRTE